MRWFFPMVSRSGSQSNEASRKVPRRRGWRKLYTVIIAVVGVLAIGGALAWGPVNEFIRISKLPLEVSIIQGSDSVVPGDSLWIVAPNQGCNVTRVELYETQRAAALPESENVINWQAEQPLAIAVDKASSTDAEWLEKLVLQNTTGTSPLRVDARYRVVVEGTRLHVQFPLPTWEPWREEYSFQTLLSPVAVGVLPSYKLAAGTAIPIKWSMPMEAVTCSADSAVGCVAQVDPSDPTLAQVSLQNYKQGATYRVTVTGALAANGVASSQSTSFKITTPPAIAIATVGPEEGEFGLDPTQEVTITFSEPIKDRELAEAAVVFDPPVKGHFEWAANNQVAIFHPDTGFPWLTDVTASIKGSPSVRGISGGYLEGEPSWTFTTRPNKILDVNLTRQTLTCIEDGNPVFTVYVATGVYRAETPTGTFMVLTKLPFCRMAGVNPSGLAYDIPNVPWTMPFWGDYTIHAAPWRAAFGTPGSNGCVSMTTPDAKRVYDWTPVGTRIQIHY
jgi:lipoprotein-anchoring transpeptidase ErfK/SrfK